MIVAEFLVLPRRLARACRSGLGRLARSPRFAALGALTITLAIVPSVVFRLVGTAVLPPLPYERAEELSALAPVASDGTRTATSYPKIRLLMHESRTLDVAALTGVELRLRTGSVQERLAAVAVTPSFFRVLGAPFPARPRIRR